MVLSAGLAAFPGSPASPEAVQVIQERGMDLTRHESRGLTDSLVLFADLILTMTQGHRNAIIDYWPEAAPRRPFCAGMAKAFQIPSAVRSRTTPPAHGKSINTWLNGSRHRCWRTSPYSCNSASICATLGNLPTQTNSLPVLNRIRTSRKNVYVLEK